MIPSKWRTDLLDVFAEEITTAGAEFVPELGCGTGQLARYLLDLDFDATAIDLSRTNIKVTQARGVHSRVADFAFLPFPDGSFGSSLAINSLLHVPPSELSNVFSEIALVLRPGALLLTVVWGGITEDGFVASEWLHPPRYFSSYSEEDLLALDTPGFMHRPFDAFDVVEADQSLRSQVLTLRSR
jgi:SAM-dependent methyltransferase